MAAAEAQDGIGPKTAIGFSQTEVVQGTINFAVGTPGPELIPKQALDAALTAAVARNTDPLMYQYARIRGTDPFGTAVAAFLQSNGLRDVKASHVCASFGNSLALATIAKIFACPGDCAVVEDPTYFLAGKIFADAGIRCVRVGVDCDGLQVDALEQWLRTSQTKPSLVYCIPTHHNPTSASLTAQRHHQLVAMAMQYGFVIVYDDPYSLLQYTSDADASGTGAAAAAATTIAGAPAEGANHVISLGSFSKILTPGLRLGWILASPDNIRRISEDGALNSGGGPANVITEAVRYMLESGQLQNHVRFVRSELGARAAAIKRAVDKYLKGRVACRPVMGGYFMFLHVIDGPSGRGALDEDDAGQGRATAPLPEGFSTAGLRQFCDTDEGAGVAFMPVTRCAVAGAVACGEPGYGALPDNPAGEREKTLGMRLSVSYYPEPELEEGIRRLAAALDRYLSTFP